MRRKYSDKSKEGGVFAERRRGRGGRGLDILITRKNLRKGGNINMKNHYVPVAEEGKDPHRQLYK